MDAQPDRMHMVMEARDTGQPLRGQTALVTGASSGIGEGVARALAAAGAAVVQLGEEAPVGVLRDELLRRCSDDPGNV